MRGGGGVAACVSACPGTSVCVCVSERQGRGIVVPVLFWPPKEGSRGSEELERRRKKCHSNTASVKGI